MCAAHTLLHVPSRDPSRPFPFQYLSVVDIFSARCGASRSSSASWWGFVLPELVYAATPAVSL